MKQYCAINRITQCGIIKTNIALISPYNSQHDIKTLNDPNHPLLGGLESEELVRSALA